MSLRRTKENGPAAMSNIMNKKVSICTYQFLVKKSVSEFSCFFEKNQQISEKNDAYCSFNPPLSFDIGVPHVQHHQDPECEHQQQPPLLAAHQQVLLYPHVLHQPDQVLQFKYCRLGLSK